MNTLELYKKAIDSNTLKVKDVDAYVEWIVASFGSVLVHGGLFANYRRARRHVNRLAKLVGESVEETLAIIEDRYNELFAE